jgi:plasmid maintenance system antidote protein VapI
MNSEELLSIQMRHILEQEYNRRSELNSKYSLRAFSLFLKIEPSALHKMLYGKRRITFEMSEKITKRLGLNLQELLGVSAEAKNHEYKILQEDQKEIVSKWSHYAILELAKTEDFKPNSKWIAQRLGLTVLEVDIALRRLERLGLIVKDGKNLEISSKEHTTVGSQVSGKDLSMLQSDLLKKSLDALDMIPIEVRDQSTMTFTMDLADIDFAKEEIKKFRRSLCRKLEKRSKPKQVYNLNISLIPLTNIENTLKEQK